jgi:hypothetical protein
MNIAVRFP